VADAEDGGKSARSRRKEEKRGLWNVGSKLGMSLVRASYASITAQNCNSTVQNVRLSLRGAWQTWSTLLLRIHFSFCGQITCFSTTGSDCLS
jgi:hypothetical protein